MDEKPMSRQELQSELRDFFIRTYSNKGSDRLFFSITVTLKPKVYKYTSITQYELSEMELRDVLKIADNYIMVAELTKIGNIHYHAVVSTVDKYRMCTLINKLKKTKIFGFHLIKEINCEVMLNNEINYLYKEVITTESVLHTKNYKPPVIQYKLN